LDNEGTATDDCQSAVEVADDDLSVKTATADCQSVKMTAGRLPDDRPPKSIHDDLYSSKMMFSLPFPIWKEEQTQGKVLK
jgi:hypothetical protein